MYFVVFLFLHCVFGQQTIIFGGIFDDEPSDQEAFTDAVEFLNQEENSQFHFASLSEKILGRGPFGALQSTCRLLSWQAVAIFGPHNEENVNAVQGVCDYKDLPHVISRWVYKPEKHSSSINFFPHSSYLSNAYLSVIKLWEWKSFTVLFEDNESVLRVGELIREAKNFGVIVTVKKLDLEGGSNYRQTLKAALLSKETHFVIDCKIDNLENVLIQAQQIGLITSDFSFLITNLDFQIINLEPFRYSAANITGFRLFNIEDLVQKAPFLADKLVKTKTILLVDAVNVLAKLIKDHGDSTLGTKGVTCNSTKTLKHGATIAAKVKASKHNGLSGNIEFDNMGQRDNFNLEILELHEDGLGKIGTWNTSKGLSTLREQLAEELQDVNSLRNKSFVVITCLTDPYCMLKETASSLSGNNRFEGFGIDLIHELSLLEGFNYTFVIRADKANGSKNKTTGKWSGMIGDVREYRADLAITDLTITAEREEAVDFTSPFMNLGISILAKKPTNAPPSFFSFADPFALDTWIGLALAYALVTVSFFLLGRIAHDEWTNPYPCVEEPDYLINQFSLKNSAWYAMGALMQQGTEIAPIATSTRMVAGVWWFFALIMASSYTASLAAFLATKNPIELFSDVQSLVQNIDKYELKLGAKAKGATEGFFKSKEDPVYKAIAKYMESHPEDMVNENKHGVAKAEKGQYAFFMESTSIEYEIQRHCEVQQYGTLLDDKGYGIAMRKNAPYRKKLSTAILKLQASGEIENLKRKWWEEKRGGGQCNAQADSGGEASPLFMENLEGVFYVTIFGTIVSILFVMIEMLIETCKLKTRSKISFKEAFKSEMKAFLDFNSNVKSVINAKSSSSSSQQQSNNNSEPTPYGFIPALTCNDNKSS